MSLFEELKRRNVFRVGIAYVISAWVLLQFIDLVLENIQAPDWVMKVFMLALAIGFPLAVFFAWAFEMTPEGIKKEKDVDRSQSITQKTAISPGITLPRHLQTQKPGQVQHSKKLRLNMQQNPSPYYPSPTSARPRTRNGLPMAWQKRF